VIKDESGRGEGQVAPSVNASKLPPSVVVVVVVVVVMNVY